MFSFKTTLVPLEQMTSVLRVSIDSVDLTPGMWVRVKRGLYQGDLAMVTAVDASGTKVELKVLPRLSLEEENPVEKKEGQTKRKKKVELSKRPQARPFDPEEVREKVGSGRLQVDTQDETVFTFNQETYKKVLFFDVLFLW